MTEIYLYQWQSFSITGSTRKWLTDTHAFESLEDALTVGLDIHKACTEHPEHRVICTTFNSENLEKLGHKVVYVIQQEVNDAS